MGPGLCSGRGPVLLRRHGPERCARACEAGLTLVELLVTIAIMGSALVFMIGTMFTTARVSGFVAQRSQTESYARRVTEAIRGAQPFTCTAGGTLQAAYSDNTAAGLVSQRLASTGGAQPDFMFTALAATSTSTPSTSNPSSWATGCPTSTPALEWVQIKVWSTKDPSVTATVAVIQRNSPTS